MPQDIFKCPGEGFAKKNCNGRKTDCILAQNHDFCHLQDLVPEFDIFKKIKGLLQVVQANSIGKWSPKMKKNNWTKMAIFWP